MPRILGLIQLPVLITMAHYDSAYFRNSNDPFEYYKDWMKNLHDDVWLSELSLPGTHDSGTFKVCDDIVANQALDFEQQLNYGIRVFDIRIRHTSDRFALHHGIVFLNVMFGHFLHNVNEFLHNYPSETVLFRISKERPDKNDNTRSMEETLVYYLSKYPNTYKRITTNIKLQDARGKFLLISYENEFDKYGLSIDLFNIQDQYELGTNWGLYDKWLAIRSHLNEAAHGNASQFFMNYLSGTTGSFPYFVVSGHSSHGTSAPRLATGLTTPVWSNTYPEFPRVDCLIGICTIAFEGTNVLTRNWIMKHICTKRTTGIIMTDFPGTSLIAEIIQNNFRYNLCK